MFDLSSSRDSRLQAHALFVHVRVCVFKQRVGGGGVLSDPERMNKKLISLFQGILPVMSDTVPSHRGCGSAVECALQARLTVISA